MKKPKKAPLNHFRRAGFKKAEYEITMSVLLSIASCTDGPTETRVKCLKTAKALRKLRKTIWYGR